MPGEKIIRGLEDSCQGVISRMSDMCEKDVKKAFMKGVNVSQVAGGGYKLRLGDLESHNLLAKLAPGCIFFTCSSSPLPWQHQLSTTARIQLL